MYIYIVKFTDNDNTLWSVPTKFLPKPLIRAELQTIVYGIPWDKIMCDMECLDAHPSTKARYLAWPKVSAHEAKYKQVISRLENKLISHSCIAVLDGARRLRDFLKSRKNWWGASFSNTTDAFEAVYGYWHANISFYNRFADAEAETMTDEVKCLHNFYHLYIFIENYEMRVIKPTGAVIATPTDVEKLGQYMPIAMLLAGGIGNINQIIYIIYTLVLEQTLLPALTYYNRQQQLSQQQPDSPIQIRMTSPSSPSSPLASPTSPPVAAQSHFDGDR
jgi:hypothetical protein